MQTSWRIVGAFVGLCGTVALLLGGCGSIVDPAAETQFKQALGSTTMTVFPAVVQTESVAYEPAAAQRLAQFLTDQELAEATVSDAQVPITGGWSYDESKMWRESARALATYVQEHPISTQYAMLPEYLGVTGARQVGGVHLYVVDKDGKIAAGLLLNSHHKAFAEVNPKTADDCTALLVKVIPDEWKAN
jgi:hypothetical protein